MNFMSSINGVAVSLGASTNWDGLDFLYEGMIVMEVDEEKAPFS